MGFTKTTIGNRNEDWIENKVFREYMQIIEQLYKTKMRRKAHYDQSVKSKGFEAGYAEVEAITEGNVSPDEVTYVTKRVDIEQFRKNTRYRVMKAKEKKKKDDLLKSRIGLSLSDELTAPVRKSAIVSQHASYYSSERTTHHPQPKTTKPIDSLNDVNTKLNKNKDNLHKIKRKYRRKNVAKDFSSDNALVNRGANRINSLAENGKILHANVQNIVKEITVVPVSLDEDDDDKDDDQIKIPLSEICKELSKGTGNYSKCSSGDGDVLALSNDTNVIVNLAELCAAFTMLNKSDESRVSEGSTTKGSTSSKSNRTTHYPSSSSSSSRSTPTTKTSVTHTTDRTSSTKTTTSKGTTSVDLSSTRSKSGSSTSSSSTSNTAGDNDVTPSCKPNECVTLILKDFVPLCYETTTPRTQQKYTLLIYRPPSPCPVCRPTCPVCLQPRQNDPSEISCSAKKPNKKRIEISLKNERKIQDELTENYSTQKVPLLHQFDLQGIKDTFEVINSPGDKVTWPRKERIQNSNILIRPQLLNGKILWHLDYKNNTRRRQRKLLPLPDGVMPKLKTSFDVNNDQQDSDEVDQDFISTNINSIMSKELKNLHNMNSIQEILEHIQKSKMKKKIYWASMKPRNDSNLVVLYASNGNLSSIPSEILLKIQPTESDLTVP